MDLSFEYCHIYPGKDNSDAITAANTWAPGVLAMFPDVKTQTCIMVDDLHGSKPLSPEFLQDIIDQLVIKPDCIVRESSFKHAAAQMIEMIDPDQREFIKSGDAIWLREHTKKYKTKTEFLVAWEEKDGGLRYSCPSFAAASYLVRLGLLPYDITPEYGKPLAPAKRVVTVLSSSYLQVEDKAQSLVEACASDALRKISWFFY